MECLLIFIIHHKQPKFTVLQPYTVDPPKQQTPTYRKTITSGEMRWNPIFNRLEYELEKTTYGEKSFRIRIYRGA